MRISIGSHSQTVVVGLAVALATIIGCGSAPEAGPFEPAASDPHDHPSAGPHGGSLIELGNDEYHAELVVLDARGDDTTPTVTIYLLDSTAKVATPVDAKEMRINLTHDGNAEQFILTATPDASDPAGKSSKFVSDDAELTADLDLDDVKAQLVVTIGDKQFRGTIMHHDDDHERHTAR